MGLKWLQPPESWHNLPSTFDDALLFAPITDWPLFEYDEEAGRYFAATPFTSPQNLDLEALKVNPVKPWRRPMINVLNGYGGGSIRPPVLCKTDV